MEITKTQSNSLFVAKAFAILSVICAHMTFTNEYIVAETIRNCLGQIGVCVFLILSGFFYKRKENDSKEFWSKKLKSVFVPWLLLSICTFMLSAVLKRLLSGFPFSFIQYFLGFGSLYWYMTISFILFVVFKYITKNWQLVVCVIISILSVYLSFFKIIPYNQYFNQYLNPFNWVGFFALGILLRKENLLDKLINIKAFVFAFIGFVMSIVAVIAFRLNEFLSYTDVTSLFTEIFGFIVVLNLSNWLSNSKLLIDIGKKSFFIYLMHIQVAGAINTRLPYNTVFFILRPFIALAVCYIIAVVFKFILEKIKLSKFCFAFGLGR